MRFRQGVMLCSAAVQQHPSSCGQQGRTGSCELLEEQIHTTTSTGCTACLVDDPLLPIFYIIHSWVSFCRQSAAPESPNLASRVSRVKGILFVADKRCEMCGA